MNKAMKMGMGAVGLLLFFAACEKEIPANIGEGKKVPILFSIEPTSYNTEDEMVRSGGVGEPVTSTIPLDNEFCLEATLVPDADAELRGPTAFKEGQKLCFAAFSTGGTQVGTTAVYTYSGGKWMSSAPLGVTPDNSTEYRFVAYSYFDETGTPPTDGAGIDPVHDLVWGMSVDTKIEDETEAARTVTIHMTHKFARVKVRIKSSITGANIAYLNGIAIDGGQTAGLNLFTGNITWSGSVNQDMGLSGNYSAGEVASEYRTVKPVASPTRVRIGSVRVNTSNTTFSGTVDIGLALNGATSYNLLVEVKKYPTIFAYSNVVWNGSKLTFATTAGENSTVAAGVQGVFFKWGSLVAVSPVGSGYVAGSSIVYSPTGINNYAWGSIPYADETGAPFANDAATDDDFATYNGSLGYNATTGKGDICRYISAQGWVSGSWRLPKGSELTALMGEKTPGYYGTRTYLVTPSGGSNAYGYYQPDAGAILGNENLCVPASGTFTMTGVSSPDGKYPGFVGAQGYFHSGSSSGGSDSFYLSVSMSPNIDPHIVLVLTGGRPSGVPIRCIRIN